MTNLKRRIRRLEATLLTPPRPAPTEEDLRFHDLCTNLLNCMDADSAAKIADEKVKQEVQEDLARKVVGNAATETDWVASGGSEKAEPAANRTSRTTAAKSANDTKPDH